MLLQHLRQQELAPSQSEATLKGHRFEQRIGECGEGGGQVGVGFLLLEALEEMEVAFLLI